VGRDALRQEPLRLAHPLSGRKRLLRPPPNCFAADTRVYRPLVDLLGHSQLGGKTMLYLVDGLSPACIPATRRRNGCRRFPLAANGRAAYWRHKTRWPSMRSASIFLSTEWPALARRSGVDDYLREAALANDPPSGTFYDPDHATATQRLASLGAHEHWNDPREKRYSRNLGTGEGIELVGVKSV